ncbi:MAG: RDD family protein [Ferruginibacter sp.]
MKHARLYTVISIIICLVCIYEAGSYFYYSFQYISQLDFATILSRLIGITPTALGLAGSIIFLNSRFKKSGLLRMFMCFKIFVFLSVGWIYISYFLKMDKAVTDASQTAVVLAGFLSTLIITVCCCIGLWLLSREQKIKLNYSEYGEERMVHFEPAGAGRRLGNYIIDSIIILIIVLTFYFAALNNNLFARSTDYTGLLITNVVALIIYYVLFEAVFNTTAGKSATNTIIVNEDGERPSFVQVLGRSFARLIPFEAFTFLAAGTRGWHDTLTNTYVVVADDENNADMNEITLDAEQNTGNQ